MEKPYNNEEELVKKMIKGLPLERPSSDFTQKVMQQVLRRSLKNSYQPLISKRAWLVIAMMFILGVLWLFYNPETSLIDSEALSWNNKLQFKNPFETIELSKTTIYAIGFMALFLLQIPFLKRYVRN